MPEKKILMRHKIIGNIYISTTDIGNKRKITNIYAMPYAIDINAQLIGVPKPKHCDQDEMKKLKMYKAGKSVPNINMPMEKISGVEITISDIYSNEPINIETIKKHVTDPNSYNLNILSSVDKTYNTNNTPAKKTNNVKFLPHSSDIVFGFKYLVPEVSLFFVENKNGFDAVARVDHLKTKISMLKLLQISNTMGVNISYAVVSYVRTNGVPTTDITTIRDYDIKIINDIVMNVNKMFSLVKNDTGKTYVLTNKNVATILHKILDNAVINMSHMIVELSL